MFAFFTGGGYQQIPIVKKVAQAFMLCAFGFFVGTWTMKAPAIKIENVSTKEDCQPFVTAFSTTDRRDHANSGALFSPRYDGMPVFWFSDEASATAWTHTFRKYAPWNMFLGTHAFMVSIFEKTVDQVVVDVGANMGQEAIFAAKHGHRVWTFEPIPLTCDTLRFNLLLNCVADRVVVVQAGTGQDETKVCISSRAMHKIEAEAFKIGVNKGLAARSGGPCENITITTVYTVLRPSLQVPPLLLKIDNEGNEYASLLGARWVLTNFPPKYIIAEVGHDKHVGTWGSIFELLEPYGYVLYFLGPQDGVVSKKKPLQYWTTLWSNRRLTRSTKLPSNVEFDLLGVHNGPRDGDEFTYNVPTPVSVLKRRVHKGRGLQDGPTSKIPS